MDQTSIAQQFSGTQAALLAALVASLTTIVVSFLTLWGNSKRDRLLSVKRVQQLEQASKRVAFWENWHRAIKPFGTLLEQEVWDETAKRHLLIASHEMEAALSDHDKTLAKHRLAVAEAKSEALRVAALPTWRRHLLLYWPHTSAAKYHLVMYQLVTLGALTGLIRLQSQLRTICNEHTANLSRITAQTTLTDAQRDFVINDENRGYIIRTRFMRWSPIVFIAIAVFYRQNAIKSDTTVDAFRE